MYELTISSNLEGAFLSKPITSKNNSGLCIFQAINDDIFIGLFSFNKNCIG